MTLTPSASPQWELLDLVMDEQEYELFDSVTSEFNDIGGFPIDYYIKTNIENVDSLYGEDPNTTFTAGFRTKLVYEPTEESSVLNAFGITSDDTLQYAMITKTIFWRDVTRQYEAEDYKPKVGDVIRTLWNNKLYEIADVGTEQRIFQGKKLVWEFILRPYRHAEESESAEDMLFEVPESDQFPDINITTETEQLSAYGDNKEIEEKSDDIWDYGPDTDSSIYGY